MRVLYHHRIGSKDGQYVHIQELQCAMRAMGHEIVPVEPSQFRARQFGSDAGIVEGVRRTIPKSAHELLELGYALIDYLRIRRAILAHGPDCIYERYNLFTPSGAWAKRRFDLPMILEVNAPLFEERSKFGGIALKRLARWTERTVWRTADYVLPVTGVLAEHVGRAGVDGSKIVIIPNGVNLDQFRHSLDKGEAKRRLGIEGKLVLGFTGFIREWHGLGRALAVLAKHGTRFGLHLVVVGHGPGRAALDEQVKALGLERSVTMTGVVDRSEIASYVAAFDIALQPSVVPYASPLKIFEYLAMGKATIAPDLPNIREILTHDVNAVLFAPDDDEAFGDAVARVCRDEALRQRLGQAGHRLVLDRDLTWGGNARKVMELFQARCRGRAGTSERSESRGEQPAP